MSSTCYSIPLTPEPQRFSITLAAKEYRLTVRWFVAPEGEGQAATGGPRSGASGDLLPAQQNMERSGTWLLDIQQADNAAPIVMGIPLVAGCDLLAPYGYLGFGGQLRVDARTPPTFENLGTEAELVFITTEGAV